MLRLRKVFVCDVCGEVKAPTYYHIEGLSFIPHLPACWARVGKTKCLCPSCALEHEALKMALAKRNEKEKA